jgi:hypothetical protein
MGLPDRNSLHIALLIITFYIPVYLLMHCLVHNIFTTINHNSLTPSTVYKYITQTVTKICRIASEMNLLMEGHVFLLCVHLDSVEIAY